MKKFTLLFLSLLVVASCTKKKDVIKEYYLNGIIKSETEVKDGLRNGISKTYDEQGRLQSTAEFVNDSLEGWMITYNPNDGKISAKAFYRDDKQNGPVTLYYVGGQLYREEKYVDGRLDSIVKTYWIDGKLQAELEFKRGSPGLGLKEYDQNGNTIQHPKLIIEEVNELRFSNAYKLKIYVSDHSTNVDYFLGDLIDDKFLDQDAIKVNDRDGVAILQYNILKHHKIKKRLGISARVRTEYGNTLLLHRVYNLEISN